jgi:hypothetical protein
LQRFRRRKLAAPTAANNLLIYVEAKTSFPPNLKNKTTSVAEMIHTNITSLHEFLVKHNVIKND